MRHRQTYRPAFHNYEFIIAGCEVFAVVMLKIQFFYAVRLCKQHLMFRRVLMPASSMIRSLNSFLDYIIARQGESKRRILPTKTCYLLPHLFCSLPHNRSIASSEACSPDCAIYCFLFQLPGPSCFLRVIQKLLTCSALSSRPFYLCFNNVI